MKGFDALGQVKVLQEKMARMQEELEQKTVEGSAGGGMVTVLVNGKLEVLHISIDPQVVNAEDVEMLEDLVLAAVNDGLRRARDLMTEELGKLAGGLAIPGLKLPGLF